MTPETTVQAFFRSLRAFAWSAVVPLILLVMGAYTAVAGAFAELRRDFKKIMKGG